MMWRVALLFVPALALKGQHEAEASLGREEISSIPVHLYRKDCWKKRPVTRRFHHAASLLRGAVQTDKPGAGMGTITPFDTVYKDGFYSVDCTKDYMYSFGDKFGNNADQYKLGDRSGVSIVFYNDHVDKADREKMTPSACFAFCRTVPDMIYFGLVNGGNCYCAPYYQPSPGDSSQCDAVCDGDGSQTCGGKTKSNIFGMHMCNTNQKDFLEAYQKAMSVDGQLQALNTNLETAGTNIQNMATAMQKSFGAVGDSGATAQMQEAKVWAGEIADAVRDAKKLSDSWQHGSGGAGILSTPDVGGQGTKADPFTFAVDATDHSEATKAEANIVKLEKIAVAAEKEIEDLDSLYELARPDPPASNDTHQYYPVMYFVDKEFEKVPQTCGGDLVSKPFWGTSDDCAVACDNEFQDCVGFGHFATATSEGLCFMYSKLKTATYYTKCDSSAHKVTCAAKFAKFEGVSLAPKKDGKCDLCLTEARSVEKCYENY